MICAAETDFLDAHEGELIALLLEEYGALGGPAVDQATFVRSLRLSQADAARNYPNPQMIRAIAVGREPMPEDPVTRAAVEPSLEFYGTIIFT